MEVQKEMFAWITEVDGRDSLVGVAMLGSHTPLIASSREAIERYRHLAIAHTGALKQSLRLVRFQEMETLERYEDGKKTAAH
jgi:hypothetical protein